MAAPASFNSAGIVALNCCDNGDGTYNVQFSAAVPADVGDYDCNLLIYSTSFNQWLPCLITGQPAADTITIQPGDDAPGATLFGMLSGPGGLADWSQIAIPQVIGVTPCSA